MTKDSICGMTVDEATALHAERDGQVFYFCSDLYRKKFLTEAQPATVIEEHSCCGGHQHHGHDNAMVKPSSAAKYFCPMCPGVESDKPGDYPKSGMAVSVAVVPVIDGKLDQPYG